jgi:outer membrane protein assembly factor BamB
MLALDGATGTERWRNRTGADVMHALVRGGHGSVVGAGVTFRHEAAVDAIVVARDVRDGADVHRGRPRR